MSVGDDQHRRNGDHRSPGLWARLKGMMGLRNGDSALRDALEEIIEEFEEQESANEAKVEIGDDERIMLANILKLRHRTAYDVMVPRADIVAIEESASLEEVVGIMTREGHSRLPVYRGSLDEVVGLVHVRDILNPVRAGRGFSLKNVTRTVLFVAPSMRLLELLLEMRLTRVHMALVVDEFGGIDGLITIEDVVEEIVGDIEDEHDVEEGPKLIPRPDGTVVADARATIEELEENYGPVLSEEERDEDIDTLGGLAAYLAGRVPARGELIPHPESGISMEVLEADPRRIKRLRLRNLPPRLPQPGEASAK